jgi:hypothetical protein
MRLGRQRPEGHGAGEEALHDAGGRFDLVDGDRCRRRDRLQQVTRRGRRPLVDQSGELLVQRCATGVGRHREQVRGALLDGVDVGGCWRGRVAVVGHQTDRAVQRVDDIGVVGVVLAQALELVEPRAVERGTLGIGRRVTRQDVHSQLAQPDPPEDRRRATQAAVDHVGTQPDRLEDLRRPVRVECRDAHLRHDLEHAVGDRAGVGLLRLSGRTRVPTEATGVRQLGDRLQRQARTDRVRPVAEQRRERVRLPRVVGLDDQADVGAQARVDEDVVHRADGEQRRHRRALRADLAVAADEQTRAVADRGDRLVGERVQAGLEAVRAIGDLEGRVETRDTERQVEVHQQPTQSLGEHEEPVELQQAHRVG